MQLGCFLFSCRDNIVRTSKSVFYKEVTCIVYYILNSEHYFVPRFVMINMNYNKRG